VLLREYIRSVLRLNEERWRVLTPNRLLKQYPQIPTEFEIGAVGIDDAKWKGLKTINDWGDKNTLDPEIWLDVHGLDVEELDTSNVDFQDGKIYEIANDLWFVLNNNNKVSIYANKRMAGYHATAALASGLLPARTPVELISTGPTNNILNIKFLPDIQSPAAPIFGMYAHLWDYDIREKTY